MLTVESMFAGGVGAGPASSKPSATSNTNQFVPTPADGLSSANHPEATTTDNECTPAQIEPANEQPQKFRHTLREKIASQTPQEGQDKTEFKTKDSTSGSVPAANPEQPAPTQELAIVSVPPGKGTAAKMDNLCQQPEAVKTPNKLTELTATPQTHKSPPVLSQALNLATTESGELTSPKPETENELLLTIDQGQAGEAENAGKIQASDKTPVATESGELTSPKPETKNELLLTIDQGQAGEAENAGKMQASDKTPVATENLTNQPPFLSSTEDKGAQELTTEAPNTISKTITGDEKTAILDVKLSVHENDTSQIQHKMSVVPEKFALTAEKPADNKTDIGQQNHDTVSQNAAKCEPAQILSESSPGSGKKPQFAGDNASDDSILQKLNTTHVQVCTGQTKDHGNSAAENNANSDFEQIPFHNTAQTPVTEQSFFSSQATKTTDSVSTDDVSTSIGTQIQEHIHSSLRQGDQQITIRLNPPELGKVSVRFQEQEGQITGLLEVSKTQTRYEIEHALPQIIRNLQDSGIPIKRLEVVLTDQSEQPAHKDQSLQDGSYQPQTFSEGNHPHNTTADGWVTNDDSHPDILEPQVQITDNRIDMLA